jgi:hypothetical protein
MIQMPTKRPLIWKQFFIVWGISILAGMLIIPFTASLLPEAIEAAGGAAAALIQSLVSNLVVFAIVSLLGCFLAARFGLGLPFLEGFLTGSPVKGRTKDAFLRAVLLGVGVGVLILVLDMVVFSPLLASRIGEMPSDLAQGIRPPPWEGFLAAISAGVTEEVLFRLFLVTLFAGLGALIFKEEDGRPKPFIMWISIVLVAVGFGLSHLPATAAIGLPMDAAVISRAIVLNGAGGIVFGWLYWKWGLESAIAAHFSTDVVLHVIFAAIVLYVPGLLP